MHDDVGRRAGRGECEEVLEIPGERPAVGALQLQRHAHARRRLNVWQWNLKRSDSGDASPRHRRGHRHLAMLAAGRPRQRATGGIGCAVARVIDRNRQPVPGAPVRLRRARQQHVVLLNGRERLSVDFGLPPHRHQPVGFPVDVGELRDHVASDRALPADLLDLVLQALELPPLGFVRERLVVREQPIERESLEPIVEAGRAG